MRIMGLDVGDATIGVAVCDALEITAQGITTIRRTSFEKDMEQLLQMIKDRNVEKIIIGLPKNMNNSIGPRGEKTIEFSRKLKERIGEIEIDMWDERLSTCAAERTLIQADVSRKKRKQVIDKIAAVIILQGYLDNKSFKSRNAISQD